MLFNSFEFILFLVLVFFSYWFVFNHNLKIQNLFLLVVSYLFYGWWDWRFLSLIAFSSIVDYFVGISIFNASNTTVKKRLLWVSILVNLGFLGVFKYFNFFSNSLQEAFLALFGYQLDVLTLNVILPVGISFYTFQTMSYSLDVYYKKIKPTKDIAAFFAYVSFFPQLVAGPIERASNLLPQFYKKREFNYSEGANGLRQILWGFFKKLVIADQCAYYVNRIFDNYEYLPASVLVIGAVYFALQIYGDFSGYSDIAIGTARLFGFQLMTNFKKPYFSRDIAEFWRRWHISLSTWFRDYLYIPLGGSKKGKKMAIRNIFIIFLVSGFWHGANWTFLAWGGLNALYFIPVFLFNRNRVNLNTVAGGRILPSIKEGLGMLVTFLLTCLAWIFFRSHSVSNALAYIKGIFTHKFLPNSFSYFNPVMLLLIAFFLINEWLIYRHDDFLMKIKRQVVLVRHGYYAVLLLMIFLFMSNESQTFIYFQF